MQPGPTGSGTLFVAKAADPTQPYITEYRCHVEDVQTIDIPVDRFAGRTHTTGELFYAVMIQNGLAAPYAELEVYAYIKTGVVCPGVWPEDRIKVRFNGVDLSTIAANPRGLRGGVRKWGSTKFQVPLGLIQFPGSLGQLDLPTPTNPSIAPEGFKPDAVNNMLEVIVAQGDGDEQCFCVRVGWASLKVNVASPLVLIQANRQVPDYWAPNGSWQGLVNEMDDPDEYDPLFEIGPLAERGLLPFAGIYLFSKPHPEEFGDSSVSLEAGASQNFWEYDAQTIAGCLGAIAVAFGSDHLNSYGHSMGGLSLRGVATDFPNSPLISVMTAGAPHEGSPVADIGKFYIDAHAHVERDAEGRAWSAPADSVEWDFADGYYPPNLPIWVAEQFAETLAKVPSVFHMTTDYVSTWNAINANRLPTRLWFYAVGSDADADGDGVITLPAEFAGFVQRYPYLGWFGNLFGQTIVASNAMYQICMRDPLIWADWVMEGGNRVVYMRATPRYPTPQHNDMFDTVHSAIGNGTMPYYFERLDAYNWFFGSNHRDHALLAIQDPMPDFLAQQVSNADKAIGGLR